MRWLTLIVAILALSCRGASSDAASSSTPYHFAFVTNNSTEFWNIAAAGVHQAEKDFGIKVEIFRPLRGQVSEQQRYLENVIDLKLDGLAVNPVSPEAMTSVLNRVAATMPVICHDSDAPHSQRRTYVGSNNVEAGRAAGRLALSALGEKRSGKVALFVGRSDMQNAVQRLEGLTAALKNENLELLPLFLDNSDRSIAKSNAEDALARYPDLVLMVGLWSYNGPYLAMAVRDSARAEKPVVIAFDENEETLKAIESGLIYATIVQKPFEFGYQSMKLLKDAKEGKVLPAVVDTGFTTVRKDNLADFLSQFSDQGKKTANAR